MKKYLYTSVAFFIIILAIYSIVFSASYKQNLRIAREQSLGATVLYPGGGGTGTSTVPSFGQMLVGNSSGTYSLTATSALGISGGSDGSGTASFSGTQGQIEYFSDTNTAVGTSSIFLASNGYVGIGTTAPLYKLSVDGNFIATGDVYGANVNYNEGMVEEVTIADADGAAVSITEADCQIRSSSTWDGDGKLYRKTIAASSSLLMTDDSINYIVVNWNSGTPIYQSTTTRDNINNSNIIPVSRIYMESGNIEYQLGYGEIGKSVAIRNFDRVMRTRGTAGIEREPGGLTLSETATRVVNISSGYAWFGEDRNALTALVQTGANAHIWYHTGGNWVEEATSTYNNLQYDNGTNLTVLTANRYTVNYIFRNLAADEIGIVLGQGDYTLAQAEAAMLPTPPVAVSNFYVLVGRIIVQKSANTATAIEQAVSNNSFAFSSAINHNDTLNIQGGAVGDYYHLTSASSSNLSTFYYTPSNRITAGDGIDWSTNTLNVNDVTAAMLNSEDFGGFTCNGTSCSVDSDGTWTGHNSYPTACTTGYVTAIGDTLTCTATSTMGINFANLVGTASVTQGGTGLTTLAAGDLLYGSSANTIGRLASSTGGKVLMISTSTGFPVWVATSVLAIAGGTGTGSGTVNEGDEGQIAYYAADGTEVSGTSTLFVTGAGNVGISSSTPGNALDVGGTLKALIGKFVNLFVLPINSWLQSIKGAMTFDDTSNQLQVWNGTATSTYVSYKEASFTYSTSTPSTANGTTTIPLGVALNAETWSNVRCFTNTATASISFYDGTNRMNYFLASTTANLITLSTNNSFTAGEKRYVDIGFNRGDGVSTSTKISCTYKKTYDAD